MHALRNTLLICFAIFIDALQAMVSALLFVMGAFPATLAGGAAGCIIGEKVAGGVGCWLVGALVGVVGTPLNLPLSSITIPFTTGVGFAISFCITITFGLILTAFLLWNGMYYKMYGVGGFIAEMLPGVSLIPSWTLMTVMSVIRKTAEEKLLNGSAGSMFTNLTTTGVTGAGIFTVFAINRGTQRFARDIGIYTQEEQDARMEEKKQFVSRELKNIDGIRPVGQSSESTQKPAQSYAV